MLLRVPLTLALFSPIYGEFQGTEDASWHLIKKIHHFFISLQNLTSVFGNRLIDLQSMLGGFVSDWATGLEIISSPSFRRRRLGVLAIFVLCHNPK